MEDFLDDIPKIWEVTFKVIDDIKVGISLNSFKSPNQLISIIDIRCNITEVLKLYEKCGLTEMSERDEISKPGRPMNLWIMDKVEKLT